MADEQTKVDGAGDAAQAGSGGQPAGSGSDRGTGTADAKPQDQPAKPTYEELLAAHNKLQGDHKQLMEKYDGKFRSQKRDAFGGKVKTEVKPDDGKPAGAQESEDKPKAGDSGSEDAATIEARVLATIEEDRAKESFHEFAKKECGATAEQTDKILKLMEDYRKGSLDIGDELELAQTIARGTFTQKFVDDAVKQAREEGYQEAMVKLRNNPAGGGGAINPKRSDKSADDPTGTRGHVTQAIKELGG